MKVYIAARYGRREEARRCADDLIAIGHEVVSKWVFQPNELTDAALRQYVLTEGQHIHAAQLAWGNVEQIREADLFIALTECPDRSFIGGGRHVELGIAIAERNWKHPAPHEQIRIMLVGAAENIFMHFDWIERHGAWADALIEIGAAPLVSRTT